ncbi:hypothetical protein [uncultured Bdellovibrio sp.]|uniref:hypothetical protein n=1 Tax=Bdellovibrio sp. HCB-162 TaxID=3394234 RepID=UPI0025FA2C9D|nr:hypothetical protein [uncultured Bdellovibrio sp.]
MNIRNFLVHSLLVLLAVERVWGVPGSLTYQGRIQNTQGTALEVNGVQFEFSITNPTGSCTIYREISNGIDMRNSKGVFDVPIGTGTKAYPGTPSFKLLDSFDNSTTYNCESGGTYTPVLDDKRLLRVQFFDGVGWRLITPDSEIRAVPFAAVAKSAQKLGNNSAADFLLKSSVPLCTAGQYLRHIAPAGTFECTTPSVSGSDVSGNISGSSAGFTGTLSGDVSGTQSATSVDKIKGVAVSMTGNASGKVLKFNGTNWAPADDNVGATANLSGDVTSTSGSAGTKVEKIQGVAVSNSTPSAGQVFIYGGTQWDVQYFGLGQLRSTVTGAIQMPSSCATADKTLTWSAITDSLSCTSISIVNSQVTGLGTAATKNVGTSAGNLVQLDGSGRVPASLLPTGASGALLDGGNSTGATLSVGTNDSQALSFETNNISRMKISSSGLVGIGVSSPSEELDVRGTDSVYLQVVKTNGAGAGNAGVIAQSYTTSGIGSSYMGMAFRGSEASPASLQAQDQILYLTGYGATDSAWHVGQSAQITFAAAENFTATSSAGNILFETTPSGATTAAERMRLTSSGELGVGTNAPEFRLSLENDGGILAKGDANLGRTLASSGAGTRMIWYPRKGAFRAGSVTGTQWDDASIGSHSFAAGLNTTASGTNSVAIGSGNTASGSYSVALGVQALANSSQSSVAIGNTVTASGWFAVAIGADTVASGNGSTALGRNTLAPAINQISVGMYSATTGTENPTAIVATDPLFVIGNGTSISARSNAVTVLKNGNTGIGVSAPTAKLEINGSVKYGGRTVARMTVCSYISTTINSDAGTNTAWHYWTTGECDNGLPSGNCLSYLAQAVASGNDTDWQVLNPGESPGYGVAGTATNGGIHLSLTTPGTLFKLRAVYQCD